MRDTVAVVENYPGKLFKINTENDQNEVDLQIEQAFKELNLI